MWVKVPEQNQKTAEQVRRQHQDMPAPRASSFGTWQAIYAKWRSYHHVSVAPCSQFDRIETCRDNERIGESFVMHVRRRFGTCGLARESR